MRPARPPGLIFVSSCVSGMRCTSSCSFICTCKKQNIQQSQLTWLALLHTEHSTSLLSYHSAMLFVVISSRHIRSSRAYFLMQA